MSGAWSRLPFDRTVRQADLGNLGKNLSENTGESRRVCLLEKYSGWVFKEYLSPVALVGIKRLDRLINLPGQMTPAERALVDGHTSWPASRVLDAQQKTIGMVMPLAPRGYSTERQLTGGRKEQRVLEVDMLALTEDQQSARKLPPQALTDRITVCASIAAVAALFERHGLVYLDWSYANIFWSLSDHSAYVIDMDGCSFGPRPQIQTHNWGDPQVPLGQSAGNESDRYRVALLIARCLTGLRTVADTRAGLFTLHMRQGAASELVELLMQALKDGSAAERPSAEEMSKALQVAMGTASRPGPGTASVPAAGAGSVGGVTGWKPIGAQSRGNTSPKLNARVPPAPPAAAPQPQPQPQRPAVTPRNTASVPSSAGRASGSPGATPRPSTQPMPKYVYQPSARPPSGTPARAPSSSGGGVIAVVLILILIVVVIAIIL
jgi:hypothetical protein